MTGRVLLGCITLLALATEGSAAIIHVGDFNPGYLEGDPLTWNEFFISAAAGQNIEVNVTGGEEITGAQLYIHIGDGDFLKEEPIFTGVDYSGGIFDDPSATTGGGPVTDPPDFEHYLDWDIGFGFSEPPTITTANGLIASLLIDASGFSPGASFPIMLTWAGTDVDGDPSMLLGASSTLQHGILTISAVPEPSGCVLLLSLLTIPVVAARRWRARRAK